MKFTPTLITSLTCYHTPPRGAAFHIIASIMTWTNSGDHVQEKRVLKINWSMFLRRFQSQKNAEIAFFTIGWSQKANERRYPTNHSDESLPLCFDCVLAQASLNPFPEGKRLLIKIIKMLAMISVDYFCSVSSVTRSLRTQTGLLWQRRASFL